MLNQLNHPGAPDFLAFKNLYSEYFTNISPSVSEKAKKTRNEIQDSETIFIEQLLHVKGNFF